MLKNDWLHHKVRIWVGSWNVGTAVFSLKNHKQSKIIIYFSISVVYLFFILMFREFGTREFKPVVAMWGRVRHCRCRRTGSFPAY